MSPESDLEQLQTPIPKIENEVRDLDAMQIQIQPPDKPVEYSSGDISDFPGDHYGAD